jgi:hypothetical protein
VTAEFGEGRLEPAADAELTIARRYLQRIVTHEELDLGFEMDQGQAIRGLRGLWRRLRKEQNEMRPPHERPRLAQHPLPVREVEDRLDQQGLNLIDLPEGGVGAYMAQLEDAVRTWWQTVGPADTLLPQFGRLVDPTGPAEGQRWPLDSFLTLQVELLWALEQAERTFAEGTDLPAAIRAWLSAEKDKRFASLHNRPQRAPEDEGKFARYVSLWPPVDA